MKKNGIKLLIFDSDGTLRTISFTGIFVAYKEIIKEACKDYREFFEDETDFKKWFNHDWTKNLERIGITDEKDIEKSKNLFHIYYDEYTKLFDWVYKGDILNRLKRNYKLALCTTSSAESSIKMLGNLTNLFPLIIGNEHVKRTKPDPEAVIKCLDYHKVSLEKALIIGDTWTDVSAGKNAGIKTGIVKWGGGDWKNLCKLEPDYKFEKPNDLLNLI